MKVLTLFDDSQLLLGLQDGSGEGGGRREGAQNVGVIALPVAGVVVGGRALPVLHNHVLHAPHSERSHQVQTQRSGALAVQVPPARLPTHPHLVLQFFR